MGEAVQPWVSAGSTCRGRRARFPSVQTRQERSSRGGPPPTKGSVVHVRRLRCMGQTWRGVCVCELEPTKGSGVRTREEDPHTPQTCDPQSQSREVGLAKAHNLSGSHRHSHGTRAGTRPAGAMPLRLSLSDTPPPLQSGGQGTISGQGQRKEALCSACQQTFTILLGQPGHPILVQGPAGSRQGTLCMNRGFFHMFQG